MKLLTFRLDGGVRVGALAADGVLDLSARLPPEFGSLRAILERGALERAQEAVAAPGPVHDPDEITFEPPVPDASKILCVGVNYAKIHPVTGVATAAAPHPVLFARTADSVVGHRRRLLHPAGLSEQMDYEGELAVVIGRQARHVPESEALSYVAGYTCFNDGSVRDWQRHSLFAGKNFFASGSCGPFLVTADEVPDPARLTLITRLNRVEVQRTTTDRMLFGVPQIISYVSRFTLLRPGDILATGSPSGTGATQEPPRFLAPGDRVAVEVGGLGTLENAVR